MEYKKFGDCKYMDTVYLVKTYDNAFFPEKDNVKTICNSGIKCEHDFFKDTSFLEKSFLLKDEVYLYTTFEEAALLCLTLLEKKRSETRKKAFELLEEADALMNTKEQLIKNINDVASKIIDWEEIKSLDKKDFKPPKP